MRDGAEHAEGAEVRRDEEKESGPTIWSCKERIGMVRRFTDLTQ
ncbi:hypothetical protein AB0F24_20685 [Streptomyces platensis]